MNYQFTTIFHRISICALALFLCGCSWFTHKAKRIEAPDFTPIHQAADRAEKSTDSAAKAAAKAGEQVLDGLSDLTSPKRP